MFIDVPPIYRSPAVPNENNPRVTETYRNWNDNLHLSAKIFHDRRPDITVLMYSSWDLFHKVFESPGEFGFAQSELKKRGGEMWMDHLHPTSKMHEIIARDIERFLMEYSAAQQTG